MTTATSPMMSVCSAAGRLAQVLAALGFPTEARWLSGKVAAASHGPPFYGANIELGPHDCCVLAGNVLVNLNGGDPWLAQRDLALALIELGNATVSTEGPVWGTSEGKQRLDAAVVLAQSHINGSGPPASAPARLDTYAGGVRYGAPPPPDER